MILLIFSLSPTPTPTSFTNFFIIFTKIIFVLDYSPTVLFILIDFILIFSVCCVLHFTVTPFYLLHKNCIHSPTVLFIVSGHSLSFFILTESQTTPSHNSTKYYKTYTKKDIKVSKQYNLRAYIISVYSTENITIMLTFRHKSL